MSWVLAIAGWVVLAVVLTVGAIGSSLAVTHLRFAQYHRHKGIELPPLNLRSFLSLHLREAWAWVVLAWFNVRAAFRDRLHLPELVHGPPVVCVHGFTQNGTNFWGIRNQLHAHGRPTRAVFLGRPFQPLRGYRPRLVDALDEISREFPDEPIDVVAHSMGGVILRLALQQRPDLAARIRRIVTLGSPHAGTAAPRGFGFVGADVRELGRRSLILADLPSYDVLAPHADVTTVAAVRDFIVYPVESALLPSARHAVIPGIGHAGLLTHPESIRVAGEAIVLQSKTQASETGHGG